MAFPHFVVCMFVFNVKEAADLPFDVDNGCNENNPLMVDDEIDEPIVGADDNDAGLDNEAGTRDNSSDDEVIYD